jgi:hypothetical protein
VTSAAAAGYDDILPNLPHGTPPQLVAAIEGAAYRAFSRHGRSAFEAPRNAAIAHEVGHAIVGAHEGFTIRAVAVFSRSVPSLGLVWGGRCLEAGGTWTTGPDSSADEDLRRARFIIAGLAGEAITGHDRPGSSLDELVLSQVVGLNVAAKRDDPNQSDAEYSAYAERLWHEQVWGVAIAILHGNREAFLQVAEHLHQHEQVHGGKLRKALAAVKRITP